MYDEEIGEVLRWEADLSKELRERKAKGGVEVITDEEYFSEEEKEGLKGIPGRECESFETRLVFFSLHFHSN